MSRFDQIAKEWDAKPRRLLLAENTYKAIKKEVIASVRYKQLINK